jgi:glycosyltransferase involved in cell wall biosynthesis
MNKVDDLLVESFSANRTSLRISIVTETFPPEVNGVSITLGRIVEGLLQLGHSVQVVRPRQSREPEKSTRSGLDEVLSRGLPLPQYSDLRFGLPSKNRLLKMWGQNKPDVVHVVTEGPLGWSAVAAARQLQLPVTSSFHTNFQTYSKHYGIGLFKKPIESYLRKLHNRTLATMVPTKMMMQQLRSRGYKNLALLSRGVATDHYHPSKRSNALRESWGVQENDLIILLVGRLAKEKNVGLVISAYLAIKPHVGKVKLVFVGDGPLLSSLKAICPEAIYAGVKQGEELARYYASADIFLFPSLTETFGNVVPEALASGLAVVAFDCAAAQELIVSGSNGYLVPIADEFEFIHAAVEVSTNHEKRKRYQLNSPSSVSHLSWEAIFHEFVKILNQVIKKQNTHFSQTMLDNFETVIQSKPITIPPSLSDCHSVNVGRETSPEESAK